MFPSFGIFSGKNKQQKMAMSAATTHTLSFMSCLFADPQYKEGFNRAKGCKQRRHCQKLHGNADSCNEAEFV